MTKLLTIIPVYNGIEKIEQCIYLSILNSRVSKFIIIDNNSDKPTVDGLLRIKLNFPDNKIKIIRNSENIGVARAWNQGVNCAESDIYFFLNSDCAMMPEWDTTLINTMMQKKIDVASALFIEPWMSKKFDSIEKMKKVGFDYISRKNIGKFRRGHFTGVCFAVKATVFTKIGLFDEIFWLSMEEADFTFRAEVAGLNVGVIGSVTAFHLGSYSRKTVSFSEEKNNMNFKVKWGWSFQLYQKKIYNKLIRSWHKRLIRFGKMSEISEKFPIKGK